jgi:hypothetical protein
MPQVARIKRSHSTRTAKPPTGFLKLPIRTGALRVLANDGATVYVNGEKCQTTKNGHLVLYLV